jgi:peptide/nickel transport system substrate-binding protein
MRTRGLLAAAFAALALAAVAGCGGEKESEEAAPAPPPPAAPQPAATTEAPAGTTAAEEEPEIVTGGILRIGSTDHIDSLNPFVAFNAQAYVAFVMAYPVLVQYGPGYEFEGDWAESWEVSPDGLVWTFTLKPG